MPACNSHTEKARGILGGPIVGPQETSPRALQHLLDQIHTHLAPHFDGDHPIQAQLRDYNEFLDHIGLRPAKLLHQRRHCQTLYIQASTDTHYQHLLAAFHKAPPFRYGGIRVLPLPFPETPKEKDSFITGVLDAHAGILKLNRHHTTMLQPIA